MKIIDFNSYNEKIKANSINLSDLKDIEIDDKLEFTKKSLVHGRVVQFADKTYGMFVASNSKLFKKMPKRWISIMIWMKGFSFVILVILINV